MEVNGLSEGKSRWYDEQEGVISFRFETDYKDEESDTIYVKVTKVNDHFGKVSFLVHGMSSFEILYDYLCFL